MPTKPLDRLMFAQGGHCFFCKKPLSKSEASVEHLVASANGALFQKKLSEHEISSLIERLQAQGIVVVSGTKVSYEIPEKSA